MPLIKKKYGASWLLVFKHKIVANDATQLFNENLLKESYSENKYSILGIIDETYKYKGVYEFLLEYPALKGYNRWSQKKNPFNAEYGKDVGYHKISISWDVKGWKGLSRSQSQNICLIDGSFNLSKYFFAIGLASKWQYYNIPGPWDPSDKQSLNLEDSEIYLKEVNLWIRINHNQCTRYINHRNAEVFRLFNN